VCVRERDDGTPHLVRVCVCVYVRVCAREGNDGTLYMDGVFGRYGLCVCVCVCVCV